jgi:hypothetical protein
LSPVTLIGGSGRLFDQDQRWSEGLDHRIA